MTVELSLRISCFVAMFSLLLLGERMRPLRRRARDGFKHAFDNLSLFLLGALLTRLAAPVGATAAALFAQRYDLGLLNWLDMRLAIAFPVSLLVLDWSLYMQHKMMHRWTPLWRLHRVHHSDTALDVTSGIRFHPGEVVLSLLYKSSVVTALGAPPAAVLSFEIILNACSMFNHSNLALPGGIERGIRCVLVTPNMHWVHHSIHPRETRHNFGFCLSLWDRLARTYLAEPVDGIARMRLGVAGFDAAPQNLSVLLRQPWSEEPDQIEDYRISRLL